MTSIRTITRLGVVPAVAVAALAVAGPASAHVTITASDTAAGAYTILTVSVPHGCDGSATTKIAVKMPEGITEVTPTRNAYYDLEKVTSKLAEPITAEDGDEITEGVSQVSTPPRPRCPTDNATASSCPCRSRRTPRARPWSSPPSRPARRARRRGPRCPPTDSPKTTSSTRLRPSR